MINQTGFIALAENHVNSVAVGDCSWHVKEACETWLSMSTFIPPPAKGKNQCLSAHLISLDAKYVAVSGFSRRKRMRSKGAKRKRRQKSE